MKQDCAKMWWGIWTYKLKFSKRVAEVWSHFNVKQHKVSKMVIYNVSVCLKCGVEVWCQGGTTNLTSHVHRHHPQLLSTTQSGGETVKETPKIKKSDGTLRSLLGKNYSCNTEQAKNLTVKIVLFIIKDLRPYSMAFLVTGCESFE